jgi:pyruvate/2-oxoglutarate/acetoin dehydrogenase E1 component
MDFMLRALDQLVNHLDKLERMSRGQWKPKVIIRTRVGSKTPLDAGPQHTQDHSYTFATMLTNVVVAKINYANEIEGAYCLALERDRSTLIVEAM